MVEAENVLLQVGGRGKKVMEKVENIIIKQKFVNKCCETNEFVIYKLVGKIGIEEQVEEKHQGGKLFHVKENSEFCSRCCCIPRCRVYTLIFSVYVQNGELLTKKPFLKAERQCKCMCCWLSRPYLKVWYIGEEEKFLGVIKEPFHCCISRFQMTKGETIKEALDNPYDYRLHTTYQCGALCGCGCNNCCKTAEFPIFDKYKNHIGTILKVFYIIYSYSSGLGVVRNAAHRLVLILWLSCLKILIGRRRP